ncbi:MAG: HAMP domain-containing histidine kinase [Prevotella sp.]|nr:HAMP domain-containing histidine kinase [Prevotella sp.]
MTRLTKILMLLILVAVCGCTDRKQLPTIGSGGFNDAEGFNRADSIVSTIGDARNNHERVLAVIDSLEQKGELSLAKTIFYRTITYNLMGQRSTSLRLYAQLSSIDMNDIKTEADLDAYLYSYHNYVRLLCEMKRYDRALREAYAADRKLKAAGYDAFADHHDIAQTIGECQLYLGQTDLAAQSFQKALQGVHTRLTTHHDALDFRECQKCMNAIVKAYMQTGRYAEATPWIEVQDSLYAEVDAHPQRDSVFLDEMKADICYSKALLAHAQGRTADAERAFNDYQSTQTAQQLGHIINSNEYLLLTHRYEEAARNYEQLDHFLKSGGYKADFENFGLFMIPKFRANLLAGHIDSALHIATIVAEYYDTALVRQRRIDSDLLTTFYDTEGKERQIAEQRAELSQQRLLTVIIAMAVFFIFLFIYTIQRRKAYKRLDVTNRQLVIANEKAMESSRMKTNFIRQISHEVRTPLNIISGFTQVLAAPDIKIDNDELQDISRQIMENSERITLLIDKMLELSQVNSHTDIERNDTVHPTDITSLAITLSGIREADHLQLQQQSSPQADQVTIVTNQKSAAKALALLLSNAVKFTQPMALKDSMSGQKQRVTLSIDVTQTQVAFTVEDTGIGVPPEQAENIFSEFVKLDEFTDGTGIGLSIARIMVRQLGGDIVLDTSYTDGARFVMTLSRK